MTAAVDIVIPSIGRPSLAALLARLERDRLPGRVIVVDDSVGGAVELPERAPLGTVVVRTAGGAGPAAARNAGWRRAEAPFVAFLDDDVLPGDGWVGDLVEDARRADPDVAAVQGRITVPRRARATDWERNTARLETATWITADLVVRRSALEEIGGFDERFRRAYREDTDLAVRLLRAGWRLGRGQRRTAHPVRPAPWWVSVGMQAGNADDVLLERLHSNWRDVVGEAPGRYRRHQRTVALLVGAVVAAVAGRRRSALLLGGLWLIASGAFAWERISPGPRSCREVLAMTATSVAIPPVAVWYRCRGRLDHRDVRPWPIERAD